jgi:uroporphyrinogen decarboxylase
MSLSSSNQDYLLLATLEGQRCERPPIWFMRQAGRSLPEYRELREKHSMLDLIRTPELAALVTLQPIRRFNFDGAIIFADILNPLIGMGMRLDFIETKGPVFENPLRSRSDIDALVVADPMEEVAYTMSALKLVRAELADSGITMIGFCGAPFSLAAYMVEGASPKDGLRIKSLMLDDQSAWKTLQEKLVVYSAQYLIAQVKSGAQVLQIFDSSVGLLTVEQYCSHVLPWVEELIGLVRQATQVPIVYFPFNGVGLLSSVARLDCDAISIDWRTSLSSAHEQLNRKPFVLQGNLDPALLCCGIPALRQGVQDLLKESASLSVPHIFNLGHGVGPASLIDNIACVVEMVKNFRYEQK